MCTRVNNRVQQPRKKRIVCCNRTRKNTRIYALCERNKFSNMQWIHSCWKSLSLSLPLLILVYIFWDFFFIANYCRLLSFTSYSDHLMKFKLRISLYFPFLNMQFVFGCTVCKQKIIVLWNEMRRSKTENEYNLL